MGTRVSWTRCVNLDRACLCLRCRLRPFLPSTRRRCSTESGALDAAAVEAVVAAAGHAPRLRHPRPGKLTERCPRCSAPRLAWPRSPAACAPRRAKPRGLRRTEDSKLSRNPCGPQWSYGQSCACGGRWLVELGLGCMARTLLLDAESRRQGYVFGFDWARGHQPDAIIHGS